MGAFAWWGHELFWEAGVVQDDARTTEKYQTSNIRGALEGDACGMADASLFGSGSQFCSIRKALLIGGRLPRGKALRGKNMR